MKWLLEVRFFLYLRSVKQKIKSQVSDNKHLFEIRKKNAIRGHRFGQKPKLSLDYGVKTREFYEKRKKNNFINKRQEFY